MRPAIYRGFTLNTFISDPVATPVIVSRYYLRKVLPDLGKL
jgi:hypothetical protein